MSADFYRKHPNPFIKLFYDLPQGKNVFFPPKIGIWPEYRDSMINAFDQISLAQKSAADALHEVQERLQPKLDEYLERRRQRREAGQ